MNRICTPRGEGQRRREEEGGRGRGRRNGSEKGTGVPKNRVTLMTVSAGV